MQTLLLTVLSDIDTLRGFNPRLGTPKVEPLELPPITVAPTKSPAASLTSNKVVGVRFRLAANSGDHSLPPHVIVPLVKQWASINGSSAALSRCLAIFINVRSFELPDLQVTQFFSPGTISGLLKQTLAGVPRCIQQENERLSPHTTRTTTLICFSQTAAEVFEAHATQSAFSLFCFKLTNIQCSLVVLNCLLSIIATAHRNGFLPYDFISSTE